MGCDIHVYIEFRDSTVDPGERWRHFGGRINPGRNYLLFAALAGVRNYNEIAPVSKPKGLPIDSGYSARDDAYLYISDAKGEGFCTAKQAKEYLSTGSHYKCGDEAFVSNPDHHSHSWLTPDEYAKAIEDSVEPEYIAILDVLKSFERQGFQSRIVFWFDN